MTNSLEPSTFAGPPSPAQEWRWRLETAEGTEVTDVDSAPSAQSFPSQSDAESWVGEVWQDLLEDGVDAVTLFEGEREVYGPMSLHPTT